MDKQELKAHIEEILNYWKEAVDPEGGIHYIMDDFDRGPVRQNKKCLLMHARQLYDFSVGTDLEIGGAREVADHLYSSLGKVFIKHEGLYQSFSEPSYLSCYDLYFVVIGLARYAKTTKSKDVYQEANALFEKINIFFDDGDFGQNGCYTRYDFDKNVRSQKSGNTFLHRLEACNNLCASAKKILTDNELESESQKINEEKKRVFELFRNKIYRNDLQVALEGFNDDMSMSQTQGFGYVTNAHLIEWLGFWIESVWQDGVDLPLITNVGQVMARSVLEKSRTDSGCFGNNYYLQENKTIYSAGFWAQTEAVMNFYFAAKYFENNEYLERIFRLGRVDV